MPLIGANHLPEAIAVLKLSVQMYPESSGAYARLGDAYALSGRKQSAIDSYKTALQKAPDDLFADKRLNERIKTLEGNKPFSY